jgi:hypothetical protein
MIVTQLPRKCPDVMGHHRPKKLRGLQFCIPYLHSWPFTADTSQFLCAFWTKRCKSTPIGFTVSTWESSSCLGYHGFLGIPTWGISSHLRGCAGNPPWWCHHPDSHQTSHPCKGHWPQTTMLSQVPFANVKGQILAKAPGLSCAYIF